MTFSPRSKWFASLTSLNLLALLAGVSVVSFGAGYQITSAWISADRPEFLNGFWSRGRAVNPQAMIPSLSLEQPQLFLRRANFRLLTRAAYSLLDRNDDQSAAAYSFGSGDNQTDQTDFATFNAGKS